MFFWLFCFHQSYFQEIKIQLYGPLLLINWWRFFYLSSGKYTAGFPRPLSLASANIVSIAITWKFGFTRFFCLLFSIFRPYAIRIGCAAQFRWMRIYAIIIICGVSLFVYKIGKNRRKYAKRKMTHQIPCAFFLNARALVQLSYAFCQWLTGRSK